MDVCVHRKRVLPERLGHHHRGSLSTWKIIIPPSFELRIIFARAWEKYLHSESSPQNQGASHPLHCPWEHVWRPHIWVNIVSTATYSDNNETREETTHLRLVGSAGPRECWALLRRTDRAAAALARSNFLPSLGLIQRVCVCCVLEWNSVKPRILEY